MSLPSQLWLLYFTSTDDPLKELIDPAVNGTKNVISSALKAKQAEAPDNHELLEQEPLEPDLLTRRMTRIRSLWREGKKMDLGAIMRARHLQNEQHGTCGKRRTSHEIL
jgi:hypothetical protein